MRNNFQKYSNGRRVTRDRGRYAKPDPIEGIDCPHCHMFVAYEVNPRYVGGFIDPKSMQPRLPDTCHSCGGDLTGGAK